MRVPLKTKPKQRSPLREKKHFVKFVSDKLLTNRSCDPPWETPSSPG